ncbi:MAG: glycoside hydrolase N-terminal domain-containing protein [Lentisphaeria bacterium]|nr:glycoside hydrolase N-terminal domain-containing protein [Lentisphaeria bacterium]
MDNRRNILTLLTPAAWPLEQWREATPLGNGETGLSVHGGVYMEKLLLNRHDLWRQKQSGSVPDVSGAISGVRQLMDAGNYREARDLLTDRLLKENCPENLPFPMPLAEIVIRFETPGVFSCYRRQLDMANAESLVTYETGDTAIRRRAFVSRSNGLTYWQMSAGSGQQISLDIRIPFTSEDCRKEIVEIAQAVTEFDEKNNILSFYGLNDDGLSFGCVCRISGAAGYRRPDGSAGFAGVKNLQLTIGTFANAKETQNAVENLKTALLSADIDYERQAGKSAALHRELYERSSVEFDGFQNLDNESLLSAAYENAAPAELIEKIWRFGHYLFICGYDKNAYPFHLYGLWNGSFFPTWAAHVANENVEAIYWHTTAGGLAETVRPLLDYYCDKLDFFRETARKVYGCRGIYISSYSTPQVNVLSPLCPVILHFNGVAGWLARHFYDCFLATGDEEMLKEKILPFMYEAALFYEDYVTFDDEGKIKLYPSVSPENTPLNFMQMPDIGHSRSGHPQPVTENATVELAIIKELLGRLIEVAEKYHCYTDHLINWQKILDSIPPYRINADGAVAEWLPEKWIDKYDHRHLSHLYPVFPGCEVRKEEQPELFAAFEKAVDLRILGSFSGWTLPHMAAIYSRFNRGDDALHCVDILAKSVLLKNFFTLHNDYRNMGMTIVFQEGFFPVQLDALLGTVNAIQEMLLYIAPDQLKYLPALPERLKRGRAKLHFFTGFTEFEWDVEKSTFSADIYAVRDTVLQLSFPEYCKNPAIDGSPWDSGKISLKSGEKIHLADIVS